MKVVNSESVNVHFLCATAVAPHKNKMFYSQIEVTKNKREKERQRMSKDDRILSDTDRPKLL